MLGSIRHVVRVSLVSATASPAKPASPRAMSIPTEMVTSRCLPPCARIVRLLAAVPLDPFQIPLELFGQRVALRVGRVLRDHPDQPGIYRIHWRPVPHHHEMDAALFAPHGEGG